MHHINERFRISINIKANHSFKVLPEKNFDKKNVLGCVSRKSDREINKINSKPRFENELELSLARSCLRPAQRFYISLLQTGRLDS